MYWLEDQMASNSRKGALLQRVLDLDSSLQYGIQVSLDEIDCLEFKALKLVRLERAAFEKEESEQRN